MRIDAIKLTAELMRQDLTQLKLAEKAGVTSLSLTILTQII